MHYAVMVFTPLSVSEMAGSLLDDPMVRSSFEIVQACIHAVDQTDGSHTCSLCANKLGSSEDVHSIATVVPVLGLDKGQVGVGLALCRNCAALPWEDQRDRLMVVVQGISRLPVHEVHVHAAGHA